MVFYQVDAYLEQATLHLAASRLAPHQNHVHQATASLEEAKQLMYRMGYYRRHRQVTALEAMLQEAAALCSARPHGSGDSGIAVSGTGMVSN